jgi:hypothetical protein
MRSIAFVLVGFVAAIGCGKKDNRSEGEVNLARLAKAAEAKLKSTGGFVSSRIGPTPTMPCCNQPNQKCAADPTIWTNPGWVDVGFKMDGAHQFQYSYEGSTTQFTGTAVGDLDCDGKTMTVVVRGEVQPNKQVKLTWELPTAVD